MRRGIYTNFNKTWTVTRNFTLDIVAHSNLQNNSRSLNIFSTVQRHLPPSPHPERTNLCLKEVTWTVNPSAWSDEHCSSCCTLSLIRLYLDNIGGICNRAASCLFMKELALLWCGRQLLEIISSFFLCSRSVGFLFAVPNFTDGFMRPFNSEMK